MFCGKIDDISIVREWTLSQTWKPLASAEITKNFVAPGVKRIIVRDNGLVGTLFIPKGNGPFPGIFEYYPFNRKNWYM